MKTRSAVAEMALYGVAAWVSYEMAKTPEQRLRDRLRHRRQLIRCCWWAARSFGRLALEAELAYYRKVKT